RETIPLLSQENIDRFHTPKAKLTLLLFDEIEKASDSLWNLLLGILDKATLTLGDNRRVDFSNCIVVMTSNLGAREMSEAVEGRLGFTVRVPETAELDSRIEKIGIEAARRKFSPEFMNRLDKVVVFRSLAQEALEQILNIEIATIQRRIIASGYHDLVITCSSTAKSFLLNAGFDRRYGARPLKRVMEKYLVIPLSNLVATKQVGCGDVIYVDHDDTKDGLRFMKLPGVESEKRTMNAQASFNIGQLTI
ncbi:MAG TPA: AAA family ATPase, partial [Blastocatellia bacterium]|nr:AAA family ATPase [Blastocatellia bacterium]